MDGSENRQTGEIELLTAEEAALLLKVAANTVYRLMRGGEIPFVRFGRCVRIRRDELQRFIASHSTNC